MTPTINNHHLTLKEKIGYALGDSASNFYWRIFDLFLFIFYTDIFGIPAAAVGTMFLVTRLIDALSDPLMGALADRTTTRWGKFRPYLLLGIIPLVAAGILTFTVPDLDSSGKLVWAYATYIFMMIAYTFINVPYGALIGVITSDSQQRTQLTSFRFIGAFSGGTLVAYFAPKLVDWIGQGDQAFGWQVTMILFGLLAAICFVISFLTTKERIAPPPSQQSSVWQDIQDLGHNKPWLILFTLALVIMLTISLRGSSGTFYFKYYVGREDLIASFSMVYMISLAIGAAITPILTRFCDKRRLLLILMSAVALLSVLFYFIPKDSIALIYIVQFLIGLCLGPKSPLVFSMYADTADYGEWRNGRRATAMVFSAAAFSQKLGGALAGATLGWVLAWLGYTPNETQADASEHGIVLLMTLIPAIFAFISVLIIKYYPLSENALESMQLELVKRREQN